MDVRIVDTASLEARTPSQIYTYLLAKGWQVVHEDAMSWAWERNEPDSESEIWLPKQKTVRGYPSRVASILKTLSTLEDRSELQILFEISNAENDVQRVRTFPEGPPGTLSLEDGEQAISGLKKWVLSAATLASTPNRTAIQPRRKPAPVLSFMHQVKLAAPEEGSFIWAISIPIVTDADDRPLPFPSASLNRNLNSFNRQVTMELHRSTHLALQASNEVLREPRSIAAPFRSRIKEGLTANLCEALYQAGGENHNPFEVSFSWATSQPSPSPDRLRFTSDNLRVLREAAEELRNSEPEEGITIQGFVVRLAKESNESPRLITIAGVPTDGPVDRVGHYWVELTPEEYRLAHNAHGMDQRVSVSGDITRRGNRRWISRSSNFRIID